MARAMAETFLPFGREWHSDLIIIEPKMPNNHIRTQIVLKILVMKIIIHQVIDKTSIKCTCIYQPGDLTVVRRQNQC